MQVVSGNEEIGNARKAAGGLNELGDPGEDEEPGCNAEKQVGGHEVRLSSPQMGGKPRVTGSLRIKR